MSDDKQLAILKQEIQGLVAKGASIEQIGGYLGSLWDASQNDDEKAVISATWEQVQLTQMAVRVSETAVAVAVEMTQQRDLIADSLSAEAKQHTELKKAVQGMDTDHPMVETLVDGVEEMIWEHIMELERDGIHSDDPAEDIINGGVFGDLFDYDEHAETLNDFARILFGHSRNLPDGMMERLANFIAEFTAEAQEIWQVEIQHETVAREAKMKELQLLRQQQSEVTNGSR